MRCGRKHDDYPEPDMELQGVSFVLSSLRELRYIDGMRSAAHILFSLYYLTMTIGFTLSTCTCWDPFDHSQPMSHEVVGSSCCGGADCSHACCLKEATTVQLSDYHASAEPWTPAALNHICTFSQFEYPSSPNDFARFVGQNTGPPQRNDLIQILDCSFLL